MFRRSCSVNVLNKAVYEQSFRTRSMNDFSFKLAKRQHFGNVTNYDDTNLVSLTSSSISTAVERFAVSLSALDKEIERTRCVGWLIC